MEMTIIICLSLLAAFLVIMIVVGYVLVNTGIFRNPLGLDEWVFVDKVTNSEYPGTKDWITSKLNDGTIKELSVVCRDIKVHAYYAACPGAVRTVVLTHGYSGCALQMMPYARMWFEQLHCNILVHDLPHHGQSQGTMTQMGWYDRFFLLNWINKAKELFPNTDIYLQGLSMGSATSLNVLREQLPAELKGVVADCSFSSVWDLFDYQIRVGYKYLPTKISLFFASTICYLRCGWSFREASVVESIKKSDVPVLFIHGDADRRVPVSHVYKLYNARPSNLSSLWITKDAGHGCSLILYPNDYCKKIQQFLHENQL